MSVFECLLAADGRLVPKQRCWITPTASGADVEETVVEVYISRLRGRLRPYGIQIKTQRGLGYQLLVEGPAMKLQSLRSRLIVIILTPLLVISVAAGAWQFRNATERAEDIFDRGLLSAALAISRDVAVSDGDALRPATRQLVNDTSGGELFYHVYAPDGVFVTGYSTPPVPPIGTAADLTEPLLLRRPLPGPRCACFAVSGRGHRQRHVAGCSPSPSGRTWKCAIRSCAMCVTRSFAVIAVLVLSVALVVWFGVGLGLRPLLDLEEAIAKRTPDRTGTDPPRRPDRGARPRQHAECVAGPRVAPDQFERRIHLERGASIAQPDRRCIGVGRSGANTRPTPPPAKRAAPSLWRPRDEASHLTNQLLVVRTGQGHRHDRRRRDSRFPRVCAFGR